MVFKKNILQHSPCGGLNRRINSNHSQNWNRLLLGFEISSRTVGFFSFSRRSYRQLCVCEESRLPCRSAAAGLKIPCCDFIIWAPFFNPWRPNTSNAEPSLTSISHYFPSHSHSHTLTYHAGLLVTSISHLPKDEAK